MTAEKKNLFLTGPMGSGKSSSIAQALGDDLARAGGFLTVRQRDAAGQVTAFRLTRPDGREGQNIIDLSGKPSPMRMEVFESFGIALLEEARGRDFVVLDEVGGFEVLSDSFMQALMALLESGIPCIGVMKGPGPAGKMLRELGLGDAYMEKAEKLRQWMRNSDNTLLYQCGQFDPEGLRLAREWAGRYCR